MILLSASFTLFSYVTSDRLFLIVFFKLFFKIVLVGLYETTATKIPYL